MTDIDVALLLVRLVAGAVFAVHGAQKVFGWWGGQGLRGWQGTMERMGYRPTLPFAVLSAFTELVGGVLIAVGLLTPIAGMVVVAQSIVIIAGVHWARGFFNRDNGFEFPLVLGTAFLAIVLAGPGQLSVDNVIGFALSDATRAALVVLAIVGGFAMVALPRLTRRSAVPA